MLIRLLTSLMLLLATLSCGNNPYPESEQLENAFYTTFAAEPKHLDPARAYSSDEYQVLGQIYEPVYQYHFLKRPFQLQPLTAQAVAPSVVNAEGKVEFVINLKKGIRYPPHAAFARSKDQSYRYHLKKGQTLPKITHPNQLPHKGEHELVAADYVYQIKRLANPMLTCPILPVLAQYIDGFLEYHKLLRNEIEKIRAARRAQGGILYNQESDERTNPIYLDLRDYPLRGVTAPSKYQLKIVLKKKYPQLRYWLAMPFFAPVPWQLDRFFNQPQTIAQNLTIDRFPVGTGAFKLSVNNPHFRMELSRNENFHEERYPSEGSPGDKEAGLLADAGKKLPFLDKAIFVKEVEFIPSWTKFLQGYYDQTAISSDVFDSAITVSNTGTSLSDDMKKRDIELLMATRPYGEV